MEHRTIAANGIELHVAEEGDGRPVILCHGFPELWYSWRKQLPALAEAGYRAVAPDMRGFGDSSIPTEIEAYDVLTLCDDLLGLPDDMGAARAGEDARVPPWLSEDDVRVYVETFERTGFTGGLNYYRNIDRNWELTEPYADRKIEMPALFIVGSRDPVKKFAPPQRMDGWVTDL